MASPPRQEQRETGSYLARFWAAGHRSRRDRERVPAAIAAASSTCRTAQSGSIRSIQTEVPTIVPAARRVTVTAGAPYGALEWVAATASRLGLEFTLHRPGRQRWAAAHE
jgi:hypothetical protein